MVRYWILLLAPILACSSCGEKVENSGAREEWRKKEAALKESVRLAKQELQVHESRLKEGNPARFIELQRKSIAARDEALRAREILKVELEETRRAIEEAKP